MKKGKILIVGIMAVLVLALSVSGMVFAQDDQDTDPVTAWMGIRLAQTEDGVFVRNVTSGSPAAAAAVVIGDAIVSLDGQTIESVEVLVELVDSHVPGDVVTMVVLRNGTERTLDVELGSRVQRARPDRPTIDSVNIAKALLRANLEETEEGYAVINVGPQAGFELEEGDIITAINGQPVSEWDPNSIFSEIDPSEDVTLTLEVVREGETITLEGSVPGRGLVELRSGQQGRGRGFDDSRGRGNPGQGRGQQGLQPPFDGPGRSPEHGNPGISDSVEPATGGFSA